MDEGAEGVGCCAGPRAEEWRQPTGHGRQAQTTLPARTHTPAGTRPCRVARFPQTERHRSLSPPGESRTRHIAAWFPRCRCKGHEAARQRTGAVAAAAARRLDALSDMSCKPGSRAQRPCRLPSPLAHQHAREVLGDALVLRQGEQAGGGKEEEAWEAGGHGRRHSPAVEPGAPLSIHLRDTHLAEQIPNLAGACTKQTAKIRQRRRLATAGGCGAGCHARLHASRGRSRCSASSWERKNSKVGAGAGGVLALGGSDLAYATPSPSPAHSTHRRRCRRRARPARRRCGAAARS